MRKTRSPVREENYVWHPALFFAVFSGGIVYFSTRDAWFTNRAVSVYDAALTGLGWASWLACGLLAAAAPLRRRVADELDRLGTQAAARQAGWLGLAAAGILAQFLFIKYCQYRGFQLPFDSSVTCNVAYNVLHRGSFECTLSGVPSYFAIHFMPLLGLLSPLLLAWNSPMVFLILQTAALASMPLAAYLLTYRRTSSSLAGLAGMWLIFTNPFFYELHSASVQPMTALAAVFLWAMVCFEYGRRIPGVLVLAVMALTIEQAPLTLFGLGLLLILRLGWRQRRSWLLGGGLCLASLLLFAAEMRIVGSFAESVEFRGWSMYAHLGPTPGAAWAAAATDPVGFGARLLWPPAVLEPLWKLLYSTGFLALASPLELIPWAISFLPHFLGHPQDFYHQLTLHYSSYCIGPLWWAAMLGLGVVYRRLEARGRKAWVLVWALFIGGWNVRQAPRALMPDWFPEQFRGAPAAIALVPAAASLWVDEFLAPAVSCRSFVKTLPVGEAWRFHSRLFKPDYLLFSKDWILRSPPEFRQRIAALIKDEGYQKAHESVTTLLLRHPGEPLAGPDGRPPGLSMPAARPGLDFKVSR